MTHEALLAAAGEGPDRVLAHLGTTPCTGLHRQVDTRLHGIDTRLHGKGNPKLPWRRAGQPSHLVDVVDSDQ